MKRMLLAAVAVLAACGETVPEAKVPPAAKPALSVAIVQPQTLDWPQTFTAGGNVAAWQEAIIGPELANQRIVEVRASVGDVVARGQVLARIAPETVDSELAETRAGVAEAAAALAEARASLERARQLRDKGFYSAQQLTQAQAGAETAQARVEAAKARQNSAGLRKAKAEILAPDAGIVSARSATVGATVQPGQELFRLIRGGRLEWRAEVGAADLSRLHPGTPALVTTPAGEHIEGKVRVVAPTVDARTHTALVYVDLPADAAQRISAGMFARGEFRLGVRPAVTVPQAAVLLREGFAYVFRVEGGKVQQLKVTPGRRVDDRVEISGLDPTARVVAGGVGFLADGDTVRVVDSEAKPGK
ncbi:MAG: efflux RND transporter periplasmic adaptor subunit [Rhodocyclales bacterium]|nr:efflux RND transporter periplasmic adaptor subunit [Rhodocyclales bacterium]